MIRIISDFIPIPQIVKLLVGKRHSRRIILVGLFFHFLIQTQAKELISQRSDSVLFQILNLRTETAHQMLSQLQLENPGKLYYEYLSNWREVIELVAYDDEDRYKAYQNSFDQRIERIASNYDKTAPEYNILLGEIYAHGGMANLMFGDYLSGFNKIVKTNRFAKKNNKEHHEYWLNDKLYGILNVSLGQVPSVLKWFTNLLGLTGDPEEGYSMLNRYLATVDGYPGLKSEALLYYAFGLKMTKDEELACEMFEKNIRVGDSPALALFLKANLLYKTGNNDAAIDVLAFLQAEQEEIPFHHIDYMTGKAKQHRLDEDSDVVMLKFLEDSNLKNYKKEICMRLAYHYYIQGDLEKYDSYKVKVADYPKSTTDRDREADVENERPYDPHLELLKVRFLSSGNYFARANEIMKTIEPQELDNPAFQAEYYLLQAKIQFGRQQYAKAIESCNTSIKIGEELDEPYAAEAALLAGNAAEKQGNRESAESYWKIAMKFNGKDVYFENINKKAKNMLKKASTVKGSNQSQLSSS
jgi:hypothetical protein